MGPGNYTKINLKHRRSFGIGQISSPVIPIKLNAWSASRLTPSKLSGKSSSWVILKSYWTLRMGFPHTRIWFKNHSGLFQLSTVLGKSRARSCTAFSRSGLTNLRRSTPTCEHCGQVYIYSRDGAGNRYDSISVVSYPVSTHNIIYTPALRQFTGSLVHWLHILRKKIV